MKRGLDTIGKFFIILSLFAVTAGVTLCSATEVAEPAPLNMQEVVKDYEYHLDERSDPFIPFISPKASSSGLNPNEIIEDESVLTGMQLFEPGQLTLVAILSSGETRTAMVEDVTGKGYLLNEGALIGRRGVVSSIDQHQLTITETARTRAGKELKSTVIMRLNKEGDE